MRNAVLALTGTPNDLLQELKEQYGLQNARIKIDRRSRVRGIETEHAAVYRDNGDWIIEIVDGRVNYLLFHEFLHIALEETGRFIEFKHRFRQIQEYLFGLKHIMDEHLIESEVKRRFGTKYRRTFLQSRLSGDGSYQILVNGGSGQRTDVVVRTFMDLLSIRTICNSIYPLLKDLPPAKVLRDTIRSPRFDAVVAIVQDYSFISTSAEDYMTGIRRIHQALTKTPLKLSAKHSVILDDLGGVRDLVAEFRKAYSACRA
jgi:hypothetical protein